jgi:hypothetical protein
MMLHLTGSAIRISILPALFAPLVAGVGADESAALAFLSIVVIAVAIAAGGTIVALRRRRAKQAARLAGEIADALLRDGRFGNLLASSVQLPFWRRSPVTVTFTGPALDPGLRQLARRIAAQEAYRVSPCVRFIHREAEVPPRGKWAA